MRQMNFVGEVCLVGWGRILQGEGNMDRIDPIDTVVWSDSVCVRLYRKPLDVTMFVLIIRPSLRWKRTRYFVDVDIAWFFSCTQRCTHTA